MKTKILVDFQIFISVPLTSALILFDLMFLTKLWSEMIRVFSLLVLLANTFMALTPKIGLSSWILYY